MFDKLKKYILRGKQIYRMEDPLRMFPVSPTMGFDRGMPIDRYYIEKFLSMNRADITGNILEVSEKLYSKKFHSGNAVMSVLNVDPESGADVIADLSNPETVPASIADCFICTQTYNFIYRCDRAVQSSARLLKPDGILLGSVAGYSPISAFDHSRWGDFWRFTDMSVKRMLKECFEDVSVSSFGNLPVCKAFADGASVEDFPDPSVLDFQDAGYPLVIVFRAKKKKESHVRHA